jgi:hypothetical protein
MKAHFLALTAAAATVAISGFAAPANAFTFGTDGIKFDSDTTVKFTFLQSHGSYTSALNVFEAGNLNQSVAKLFWETKSSDDSYKNEWKGTFGNAVTSETGSKSVYFTFKGGVDYVLGLSSINIDGNSQGSVYTTTSLNASGSTQQAVFASASQIAQLVGNGQAINKDMFKNGVAAGLTSGNPFASGGLALSFDDRGNANDADFQDFSVQAEAVPEPFTMGGMALAGAGISYARRRKQKQNKEA